jgi:hypothetical protein
MHFLQHFIQFRLMNMQLFYGKITLKYQEYGGFLL